ncbi:MAG: alpha/beta hydrolase [Planctomycetota bacterium]|jgi:alpha/beta superfamily hydrolase
MIPEIRNDRGERIDQAFSPGKPESRKILVIGHGVTGNMDRPWAQTLAQVLSSAGLSCLRISFSGNGGSEGKFEDSTISKEVADLRAVLDRLDGWQIAYAGHSMGAAVGVLSAAQDPRITHLLSLAGMVHTADFAQRKFGEQEPGNSTMWDKPECPLSQTYMDDMASIDSVLSKGSEITVPWLLIHGSADTVVPLRDATDIIQEAGKLAELRVLPQVDHVFSESSELMASHVADWLLPLMKD